LVVAPVRRTNVMKGRWALVLGLLALYRPAGANDSQSVSDPLPPGTLTTSRHTDEWKIKNALSAAPGPNIDLVLPVAKAGEAGASRSSDVEKDLATA
jgi:hypothetical protein